MKALQQILSMPSGFAMKSIAILAIGATTVALSPKADAVLIDLGDTTHDDATGLEWLDLTKTLGLSVNQALATSHVTSNGFRHATSSEVNTLFLNAGFLTTNNVNNPANDPAADLLLGLMGETQFGGTKNALGRGFAEWTSPGWYTRPNYHKTGLGAGAAITSLLTSNKDLVDGTAGHFLVRNFPTSVPDNGSSLILLSIALFAMHRGRRILKKQ